MALPAPGNGAVVFWHDERSLSSNIYAQRVDGQGFPLWTFDGLALGTTARDEFAPRAISDGSTGALVAGVPQWTANGNLVCGLSGHQIAPAIVHVGSGNVILVWEDLRTPDRNIWAQKLNSSGAAQWAANGLPVSQASGELTGIKIIPDGAGGAIIVWSDIRSGELKVYAQRLDGNGQRLWNPLDGVELCPGSGYQANPDIIADGAGGAIVAWTDGRVPYYDLYAQRVDANGNLMWPASGVAITQADSIQNYVQLASDGASGAYAVWSDDRHQVGFDGNSDVYAMRILSSGVVEVPTRQPTSVRLEFVSSNPTPGEARMMLDLPEPAFVRTEVLDVLGRRVRTLDPGSDLGIGAHVLTWDGRDDAGAPTASGVFFVHVRAGAATRTTRVVRLP